MRIDGQKNERPLISKLFHLHLNVASFFVDLEIDVVGIIAVNLVTK